MKGNGKAEGREIEIKMIAPGSIGFIGDGELIFQISPEQASVMAELLARIAFTAHYGREPDERGSELARQVKAKAIDEIRPRIITRQTTLLNSFLKKSPKPSPAWMAERLVDAVLKEVV